VRRVTVQERFLHAAAEGSTDVVQQLLQQDVDVNARDGAGRTALHWAAAHRHVDVMRLLVQHPKVDLAVQDGSGMCAVHLAACAVSPVPAGVVVDNPELLSLLLDDGRVSPTLCTRDGRTLLHLACADGLLAIVSYLTSRADVAVDAAQHPPAAETTFPWARIRIAGNFPGENSVVSMEATDDLVLTVEPTLLTEHMLVATPQGLFLADAVRGHRVDIASMPATATYRLLHHAVMFDRRWAFRPPSAEVEFSRHAAAAARQSLTRHDRATLPTVPMPPTTKSVADAQSHALAATAVLESGANRAAAAVQLTAAEVLAGVQRPPPYVSRC
jgi:ankyrin repeat protein